MAGEQDLYFWNGGNLKEEEVGQRIVAFHVAGASDALVLVRIAHLIVRYLSEEKMLKNELHDASDVCRRH